MDMLKRLNAAVEYIEARLRSQFDIEEAARLACVSADSFMRFFSYMTGMTLTEYVRRRRLTLAAQDLQQGEEKIIDVAMNYGYDSAAAFSRAFARQHGITPAEYRKYGGALKVYPPVSFHIAVKGAKEMDLRIIELSDTEVWGVSRQYEGAGYRTREELRHIMWADECENIPEMFCEGTWNQPGNTSYDGIWYGVWRNGRYMIAREKEETKSVLPESYKLPAGTYAAFRTPCGGLAWEEFPKLFELIFDAWLPSSQYRQKGDLVIEVLHLWTDHDLRQKNRYYEVWIPVEQK